MKKVVGIALIVTATIFTFGVGTAGISAAVLAWLVPTLAITGNLLLSSSIKPGATASFGSSLQLSGDTTAAVQLIYGEAWTGGVLRYRDVAGVNDENLYLVIVLAGHSCDSVPAVTADKNLLTLDGSGNVTSPAQYVGRLNIRYYLGSDTQTADSVLTTAFGSKWTSNHRLRGRTYAIVKMTFDETNMNSVPQFLFKVRGRKVYDARLDSTNGGSGAHRLVTESTWAWSENAVLCLNDYDRGVMINSKREAGVGIPSTRFDWSNVIAEANVCDEAVTLAIGGTEKRYTVNGIIDTRGDHNTTRALFESAFAGDAIFSDTKWRYFTGAYRTPTLSLLPEHFIGALKHTVFTGEKDRFDAMQGRYSASAEYGQIVDYAPVLLASATAGNERFTSMDFQLVNDVIVGVGTDGGARCQRVATLLLQKQTAGKRIQCTTNLYGLRAMPGETIQVTHAAFGLVTQTMRVLEVQLRPVQDGDKTGLVVDLTLEAGPSSLYTWSAAETAIAAAPALLQQVVPWANLSSWTSVLTNVSQLGNTYTKTGGTAATWDSEVRSLQGFVGCAVSFRAGQTDKGLMVGLNSDPTTDVNYTSIDYAMACDSSAGLYIYENGSGTSYGSYTTSDVFAITYDGVWVKYYKNSTLLRTTSRLAALLFLDSSFYTSGAAVSDLTFGQITKNEVLSRAWVADSQGKPAGIRCGYDSTGVLDRSTLSIVDGALRIAATTTTGYEFCFPAIPVSPNRTYQLTVKNAGTVASADGRYFRFEEYNAALPAGKTHIGDSGAIYEAMFVSAITHQDAVSNAAVSSGEQTETFSYTPTAGTVCMSLGLYNYLPNTNTSLIIYWCALTELGSNVDMLPGVMPPIDLFGMNPDATEEGGSVFDAGPISHSTVS